MKKKIVSSALAIVMLFGIFTVPAFAADKPSPWAEEQINAAIEAELVPQLLQSGYTQAATRAEFCALAAALYENVKETITDRKTFEDTQDVNVEKMAAIGVVSGVGGNKFDPDAQLTREQAAVMLSRLADAVGKPLEKKAAVFADNDKISSWAIEGVGQVQAKGIIGGVGGNMFAPHDPYTREQSIITIMRMFNKVKSEAIADGNFEPDEIVEILLPAVFCTGATTEDVIAMAAVKNVEVTPNADGSYTYKMTKAQQRQFMREQKDAFDSAIKTILESGFYTEIKSIQYNDDQSEFTIVCDRAAAETSSLFGLIMLTFGSTGPFYQVFMGKGEEAKTVFTLVDAATGEVFLTFVAPDEIGRYT